MSHFRLHEQLPHWLGELSTKTSPEIAICTFAIAIGTILVGTGRLGILIYPFLWRRLKRAFLTSMKWQVRQIFEWARWDAHTMDSVWWAVLCALAVSTAVTLWIRVPFIRPLLYIFIPLSMLTFVVLGWLDRGGRATKSWQAMIGFFWSFYIPTAGYTALAVLGTLVLAVFEFL